MHKFTRALALAALAPVVVAMTTAMSAVTASAAVPDRGVSVLAATSSAGVHPVAGSYIVTLRPGADAHGIARSIVANPTHYYDAALNGFAADLTSAQVQALSRNRAVQAIEQDAEVTDALEATQLNPPSWGLDRVDQRYLPLSNSYTYNSTGAGVHAYIIDTGIKVELAEFEGRATFDFNSADGRNTDCYGHGTHVAGTVGSASYGIAKGVRLHAVKMLNCGGTGRTTNAIAAIDWVTANAQRPAVANTSWNWDASPALETTLRNMIAAGVYLATSAGNTGADSCDRLPRKIETATAVAASDINDNRASFSSTGACVDVYAPGVAIVSTVIKGGAEAWNGTSMATPHVTGIAALYKATYGEAPSSVVHDWVNANATPDVINGGSVGGTVNRLVYSSGL